MGVLRERREQKRLKAQRREEYDKACQEAERRRLEAVGDDEVISTGAIDLDGVPNHLNDYRYALTRRGIVWNGASRPEPVGFRFSDVVSVRRVRDHSSSTRVEVTLPERPVVFDLWPHSNTWDELSANAELAARFIVIEAVRQGANKLPDRRP